MQDNRISIKIPPTVLEEAAEHIRKAKEVLNPFLHGLKKSERRRLVKMSDGSLAFVQKTLSYSVSNPEFSPNFLDVNEMTKDLLATEDLKQVYDVVSSLYSDVNDTMMLCGSEAYAGARYYYNSVKYAAKQGNLGAKPIADDLAKRFEQQGKKKDDAEK